MTIHNSSVYHVTENNKAAGWRRPPIFTSQGDSGKETGHGTELATFLKCLQDGTRPRSAIYESYKSMVLFEAIAQSAAMRKLIEVKYEDV